MVQPEHLPPRRHGVLDAKHRSHRQGRRDVYLLVRTTELYRGTRSVHYWAVTDPHRVDQGWLARSRRRPEWERSDDCRTNLNPWVTRPDSSEKIISATKMNSFRPSMDSMSSLAIFTTLMQKKSQRIRTIRRILPSRSVLVRAV